MINKIELHDFKNVKEFNTELKSINILIGENNSGKSSVLQGIHFSLMAEVIRRKNGMETVSENDLLYLPSSNIICLRHDHPYTVSTGNNSNLTVYMKEKMMMRTIQRFQ
ncbi:MAG: AAA family ATPase [Coprococcus sp.]